MTVTVQPQTSRESLDRARRGDARFSYETLADLLGERVRSGAIAAGAKLPSLRAISRERGVSVATALAAYHRLEDAGLIEARRASGFYARPAPAPHGSVPPAASPTQAYEVSVADRVLHLLEQGSDPLLLPFGYALPDPELLAAGGLDGFLGRAARLRGTDSNRYGGPKGDGRFREQIAKRTLAWDAPVTADEIAVTCGGTEALLLALKAVTRPGDLVAVESPTYFGILQALEGLGLRAVEITTDALDGIDPAALARALSEHRVRACVFSSGFNNPLGCETPTSSKLAILDLLAGTGVPLIEDDAYGDIHFSPRRPRPFLSLGRGRDVIYCGSFSKTLAPGYRLGWIVPGRNMQAVLRGKFTTSLCSAPLPQIAMADYLATGRYDRHLRRIGQVFTHNLSQMRRAVQASFPTGTRVSRPAGGLVLWVELPDGMRAAELLEQALGVGLCFAPGDIFSASFRHAHCLRLSAGHRWTSRLEDGIARLGRLACSMNGETREVSLAAGRRNPNGDPSNGRRRSPTTSRGMRERVR